MADDPFNLHRFIEAQESVYKTVLSELSAGHKQTHWMWFIFPQIEGIGTRPWTVFYSIKSLEEAQAYLKHPVLSPRLIECTTKVLQTENKTLLEIFGKPDNRKFCSCMTLFSIAAKKLKHQDAYQLFTQAINTYCDAQVDFKTLNILKI